VLVPSACLGPPEWRGRRVPVDLKGEELESAPGVEAAPTVSRELEALAARARSWTLPGWGGWMGVGAALPPPRLPPREVCTEVEAENHLRSTREVLGYRVATSGGRASAMSWCATSGSDA